MRAPSLFVLFALVALSAAVPAEDADDTAVEAVDDNRTPLTALRLPSSLNIPSPLLHALAVAGAVVVGVVGSVAVLAILLPLFGFRLCYLFGTCEPYATAYLAPNAYDAYAYSQPVYANAAYAKSYDGATNEVPYGYEAYQHPQQAVPVAAQAVNYPSAYQKRSLEYVGPILKMLSNAYDKYNHPSVSKSVEKSTASAASESKTK